jgi:elongator complex protein 3
MTRERALKWIVRNLGSGENLEKLKIDAQKKFKISFPIRNSDIIRQAKKDGVVSGVIGKPVRTLSGVAPVAVMIRPQGSCTHGCIYCPQSKIAPKSYTGKEPAAMRAISCGFDPKRQVLARLSQYAANGHITEKCDLIVMGGTFLETPKTYQLNFMKGIYEGLNGARPRTLAEGMERNMLSAHRMSGLTIETRPDACGKKEIDAMLSYGCTKVELGVQHPSDKIYKLINRGHSVKAVESATMLLKDSALKVAYHIMLGLPGSSPKKDILMVRKLFSDSRFRPDMLKIYPTLVLEGTGLEKMMEKGEYAPYDDETAASVLAECMRHIPEYVRVMRIQRDIPSGLIKAGPKKGNLREIASKLAAERGIVVREIRHNEIGLSGGTFVDAKLQRTDYRASKGKEIFLSMNCGIQVAGYLRLRAPYAPFRAELDQDTALVRELHVVGREAGIGRSGEIQHRGIGGALLAEAERIAKEEFDSRKISVMSAPGVREYYSRKGYAQDGPYVSKKLAQ